MSTIVAGVDVGSLYTKVVIMDVEGKIVSYDIRRSSFDYKNATEACMGEALRSAGLTLDDISCVISTGYGRAGVDFSNKEVTEITCHGRGAKRLFPELHTIIDIGGQDSKVISVDDQGKVAHFVMNDKCAAGTGRFLEVMAEALKVDLDELGKLWVQSKNIVEVSSVCTVFAESEIISLFVGGCDRADIAAGIHRAIAKRIAGMVGQVGLRERVAMTGGVAKNIGVVKALEEKLHTTFLIPEEPQIIGAFGAAIIAAEQVMSGSSKS